MPALLYSCGGIGTVLWSVRKSDLVDEGIMRDVLCALLEKRASRLPILPPLFKQGPLHKVEGRAQVTV